MASYRLFIKPSAIREIERIAGRKDRQRVVACIRALASHPRPAGCEKLSGVERYRVRRGRFRVVYGVDDADRSVTIVKVGDRKHAYR